MCIFFKEFEAVRVQAGDVKDHVFQNLLQLINFCKITTSRSPNISEIFEVFLQEAL